MFDIKARNTPVVKWAGGKSGTLCQLIEALPASFNRYLEPFLGGGALFLTLKSGVPAWLNDFSPALIETYETIRDTPNELMDELERLRGQYCEEFYYKLRSEKFETRTLRAAVFIFLNRTCYNGLYRLNSKGKFNTPFGKKLKCPTLYLSENLLGVSERLRNVQLTHGDFEAVLDGAGAGDFVYCDPPYLPLSRTSSFRGYTSQGFSVEDHIRLKNAAKRAVERGAVVAISNSNSPLVPEIYEESTMTTLRARRAINVKGDRRGKIEESLVALYPEGWPRQLEFREELLSVQN